MTTSGHIALRGVRVHNLKSIDVDIPHGKLVVFCGLSGSGKSSLALDTLYAEGQRRYIESFSAYTRQFLDRLEKPDADRIDDIPPAIAVTSGSSGGRSSRSTVGTTTEVADYLRLLFAKVGQVVCRNCGQEVRRESPQSVAKQLAELPTGSKYMIAFAAATKEGGKAVGTIASSLQAGFVRAISDGRMISLGGPVEPSDGKHDYYVLVDRLSSGVSWERVCDSLETAFEFGTCYVFVDESATTRGTPLMIDDRPWRRLAFSTDMSCADCGLTYVEPEPRLFSFNSPLGACPECEGFGNVVSVDMDLVVPDKSKSIREGAIAPWNTPAYAHEQQELLALADEYEIPVDVPFSQLGKRERKLIKRGVPKRKFGGLDGFFAWLEKRKYRMHIRVFLSRWRSYRPCPACNGTRLRPEALDAHIGGRNIAEIGAMQVRAAIDFFKSVQLSDWQKLVGRMMLEQVEARLGYLEKVGLGYLSLDRTMRTLSGGEARRVALTSALGSSLVNMLYVLDEPSIGLHPRDVDHLVASISQLRDRDNTVVVVEHEEAMIRTADHIIEIGPGAGERGGRVVFQGTPAQMEASGESLTGDYLAGRRGVSGAVRRRDPEHGWIRLAGARGNNLRNITVEFPLGVLCVVSGVSGSGKSTLVEETLYPMLSRRLLKEGPPSLACDDVLGYGQIDDAIMIDQSPIGRSPRSNPVTYLKIFDEIRNVFADTAEARMRNYDASKFSFNVDGGRCSACSGDGTIKIDMQFLADVYMKCSQCQGTRYRDEILDVTYRGRNIADVLEMTVREAFTFFRGQSKVQSRLKRLIDVGLDYVRLGQGANTLSGGEAQRLKLATYMSTVKRGRCLFLLDEPTTGLHFSDVVQLLDCFEALLSVGHSLIVVEHNLQVMRAADYIIDLGPGPAEEGGRVVAQGTPETVARHASSATAPFLAAALAANSIHLAPRDVT